MDKKLDPGGLIVAVAQDNPAVAALQFIRDDPHGVQFELLEGGFCNYVYKVTSRDKQSSVIMKYGEESMRLDPDEKLPMERQQLEYNCLQKCACIHPGSVPTPYCLDTKHHVIVMQDLSGWELLGGQLHRRYVDQDTARYLGQLLGKVHTHTSHHTLTTQHWHQLLTDFRQTELKAFDRSVLYERPFVETDPITKVPEEMVGRYRECVREVRDAGLDVKLQTLFDVETCLVHGDCHHKAVFVKDGRAAMFDFELAFIGHPGLQVGFVLVGYMVEAILYKAHPPTTPTHHTPSTHPPFNAQCTQAIGNIVEAYAEAAHQALTEKAFFSELTLFVGGTVFMISVFYELENMREVRPGDRRLLLDTAHTIMTRHHTVHTSQHFMTLCETVML